MIHYWQSSSNIRDSIFIPKYYNPELISIAEKLSKTHECFTIGQLIADEVLTPETGHEIGKAAYGTGDIPFVRTSDIANWEIKSAPKQGISRDIFDEYATDQDVRIGDILFVRDGTYLIGNNCFITAIDKEILYQSHIIKIRVNGAGRLDPSLLFLALNNSFVQRQIRSVQFTADIIDTIGQRFNELVIPIPKNAELKDSLIHRTQKALAARMQGKAFIKHCPKMIEDALITGSKEPIESFLTLDAKTMVETVSNETVTAEFGTFSAFWHRSDSISNSIFLPKYYDVVIQDELKRLAKNCDLVSIKELSESGIIEYHTGDEIGKMAYDTGSIPFIRTSDFSNWEINHNPKQGISEAIYEQYRVGEDIQENDILLVRDGTYLVGSSCLVTKEDVKSLFCGGLFKFRVAASEKLNPFLFLGLLNSYIVKRQIRTKQFTRDVIDTIGNRIKEVVIPIPKSVNLRKAISDAVAQVVNSRIAAREDISALAQEIVHI